jgi:competence protein ComEC
MKVEKIDAIVATHPHIDHIGGLTHILYQFPADVVYMPRIEYPTETYRSFMEAIRNRSIRVEYLEEGSEFKFGGEVKVSVFNPEATIKYPENYPENSTQFINNRSLVLKFIFRESTMLFMSDVYMAREAELIEKFGQALKADVIKVGHHGKDTSSTKPFIRSIEPEVAVIMHDGVASVQVYKNYRKVGSEVFLTYLDGTVKVSADGSRDYGVLTQTDRQSDFLK